MTRAAAVGRGEAGMFIAEAGRAGRPARRVARALAAPAAWALAAVVAWSIPAATSAARADVDPASRGAYQRGFEAFERGDVRAARIELMKALKADPNNSLARLLQARVALEMGNGVAAQTEVERAIRAGVPRDKTRHLMAHAMVLQRQFQRALEEADADLVPPQFAAYAARIRGRAEIGLSNDSRAQAEFERAVALAPSDPDALVDFGRYRLSKGDVAGATQAADKALAVAPTHAGALLFRGALARSTASLEAALPYFNQALARDPNNIEALLERAATYGDLKRPDQALADIRRVKGLIPDHPLALYLEAVLAARGGKFQEAQTLLTRTKGTLDRFLPAMMLQGLVAYQLGNVEQANTFLGRVVAQAPTNPVARKLYAATQLRKGDARGTINTLKPLVDAGQADARTYAILGSAYVRAGDVRTGQRYLEQASSELPNEKGLKTQLAMTRVMQGDLGGADAALDEVLKSDPNSLQALMMVALIDLRERRFAEGMKAANRVVQAYPELPFGYNIRGAAALGLNDQRAAEANFRTALQKKPEYFEARRNLAQLLAATGRMEEARRELNRILATQRDDVPTLLALAAIDGRRGDIQAQIGWLKRAAAVKSERPNARIALIQAYVRSNQLSQALTEADALERDFPKNAGILQLVGMTQMAARSYGEAETSFNQLVSMLPDRAAPRLLVARAQLAGGAVARARATLQRALTLSRENLQPVYADLILLEMQQKRPTDAARVAAQMKAAYPRSNVADRLLGEIRLAQGDVPGAVASLEAARKVSFDLNVANRLASAYLAQRQPAKALGVLQAYAKANPKDVRGQLAIADFHLQQQRWREAVQQYEAIRKTGRKDDPAMLNNIAWALHQMKDKRAPAFGKRAYELAPQSPAVMDTYGWILVNGGTDRKAGLSLLEKAVRLAPRDPNIRYRLAVALQANGRKEDAVKHLRLALKTPQFENAQSARVMLGQLQR